MAFEASRPTEVSAVYDRWAIQSLTQSGDGCVGLGEPRPLDAEGLPVDPPVRFSVQLVKYRVRPEDGAFERSPDPRDTRSFAVDDLYAATAIDPAWAQAMGALVQAVFGHAAQQGAL